MQNVPEQAQYAKELHERIRREFPEVNFAIDVQRRLETDSSWRIVPHLQTMGQASGPTPCGHVRGERVQPASNGNFILLACSQSRPSLVGILSFDPLS